MTAEEATNHAADLSLSQADQAPPGKPIWESQALFQGQREVLIQHGTEYYRLILTKANKLILQK